jgi:hypothetical protein
MWTHEVMAARLQLNEPDICCLGLLPSVEALDDCETLKNEDVIKIFEMPGHEFGAECRVRMRLMRTAISPFAVCTLMAHGNSRKPCLLVFSCIYRRSSLELGYCKPSDQIL